MKELALVFGLLVCLCGCDGENRELQRGMDLRTRLLQTKGCRFQTEVTADYGDKRYTFEMDCQGDADGNLDFTVTAPETIAGICGSVDGEGGRLEFSDTALCFALLAEGQLSPVGAPWVLVKTLRSGYLRSAGMEGELLRLTLDDSYEENAMMVDIWLDEEDMPVRGEVLYAGRRILSMTVEGFSTL